jgi:hypothetical protein
MYSSATELQVEVVALSQELQQDVQSAMNECEIQLKEAQDEVQELQRHPRAPLLQVAQQETSNPRPSNGPEGACCLPCSQKPKPAFLTDPAGHS